MSNHQQKSSNRTGWLGKVLAGLVLAATIVSSITPAHATSGPGCLYVVNVASWDVLNMRARPSARSAIVDHLAPANHGIIHLDAACTPKHLSWGKRWCPVSHFNDGRMTRGWVKARFIRDIDCP